MRWPIVRRSAYAAAVRIADQAIEHGAKLEVSNRWLNERHQLHQGIIASLQEQMRQQETEMLRAWQVAEYAKGFAWTLQLEGMVPSYGC